MFLRPMLTLATVSGLLMLNTGCATKYGCSGMPDGARCTPTTEIYEQTHHGQLPTPSGDGAGSNDTTQGTRSTRQTDSSVMPPYLVPYLATAQVPIRTPAQVMRIWIAPYEDRNRDLHVPGLVYTDIEERKWLLGDSNVTDTRQIFSPLTP